MLTEHLRTVGGADFTQIAELRPIGASHKSTLTFTAPALRARGKSSVGGRISSGTVCAAVAQWRHVVNCNRQMLFLFEGQPMRDLQTPRVLAVLMLALCCSAGFAQARTPAAAATGHYLLVWAGDRDKKGNDFLAVIDADPERLVVTASATPDDRTYLLKFDQTRGALMVDEAFRDTDGQPGFSFSERDWPHGWRGVGTPHGAVFSR